MPILRVMIIHLKKYKIVTLLVISIIIFMTWRFIRPLNIFVISDSFKYPINTEIIPAPLTTLRASECAVCHKEFYNEWNSTIHSQAWTDPYFQTDWVFDGRQQICKNCHIPLDKQQEYTILGFQDNESFKPILRKNPEFDPVLQHEGVTCSACHVREGKILGPFGLNETAPHPVTKMKNPNEICTACHVVYGDKWDTFFQLPPCGTVAEVLSGIGDKLPESQLGEMVVEDISKLGCVECHMPTVYRALVPNGETRKTRRHLWHGGHNKDTVKNALHVEISKLEYSKTIEPFYTVKLTNVGAKHYFPTGTPDRHLSLLIRLYDNNRNILKEDVHILKRHFMWRPFIIDLEDTRLPYMKPRYFTFSFPQEKVEKGNYISVQVNYHLLEEERRRRIGYKNQEPISYNIFYKDIPITN